MKKFTTAINIISPSLVLVTETEAFMKLKCLKCPYKLGIIKCPVSPCPQCLESKSKKHPFPEAEIKEDKDAINSKFK